MKILLASKSPRRRSLIDGLGMDCRIVEIECEENFDGVENHEVAEYLAKLKSKAYQSILNEDEVLVTADTVVIKDDTILNKPKDEQEVRAMLNQLSNTKHFVHTGVCLRSSRKTISFKEETVVWFKQVTTAEIDYYLEHGNPMDKAGSYGIQDWMGLTSVSRIEGCYYNVMGLPMSRLYEALQEF